MICPNCPCLLDLVFSCICETGKDARRMLHAMSESPSKMFWHDPWPRSQNSCTSEQLVFVYANHQLLKGIKRMCMGHQVVRVKSYWPKWLCQVKPWVHIYGLRYDLTNSIPLEEGHIFVSRQPSGYWIECRKLQEVCHLNTAVVRTS